jgi:ribonuclease HII
MPDFALELAAAQPVCGIDEAGRGPLAGPVVAAAVILNPEHIPAGLDDSKALTARKREALFEKIMQTAQVGVGQADVSEIDSLNILGATKLAMQRAFAVLPTAPATALVDGNQPPALPCHVQYVIKGDAKSLSIAAASIIAKVTRDKIMVELGAAFPEYGFEKHAGYGTAAHLAALATYGVTPHHRQSFAPVRAAMQAEVA